MRQNHMTTETKVLADPFSPLCRNKLPFVCKILRMFLLYLFEVSGRGNTRGVLTSLGCYKVCTGCHFRDRTLLWDESAIQRVSKDDREIRS